MKIENFRFFAEECDYKESPNTSGEVKSPPKFIVIHYMAGSNRISWAKVEVEVTGWVSKKYLKKN